MTKVADGKIRIETIGELREILSDIRERWENRGKCSPDDLEPAYWSLEGDYQGHDHGAAVGMMTYAMAQAVKRKYSGITLFNHNWHGRDARVAPSSLWKPARKASTASGNGSRFTHNY